MVGLHKTKLRPKPKHFAPWKNNEDEKKSISSNYYQIAGDQKVSLNHVAKYPLVWLVTPVYGENKLDHVYFRGIKIIICADTKQEWLNKTRWKKHIPMLQAIADHIIDNLRGDLKIEKKKLRIRVFYPGQELFVMEMDMSFQFVLIKIIYKEQFLEIRFSRSNISKA